MGMTIKRTNGVLNVNGSDITLFADETKYDIQFVPNNHASIIEGLLVEMGIASELFPVSNNEEGKGIITFPDGEILEMADLLDISETDELSTIITKIRNAYKAIEEKANKFLYDDFGDVVLRFNYK